jgi:hypothetical protein
LNYQNAEFDIAEEWGIIPKPWCSRLRGGNAMLFVCLCFDVVS